MKNRKGNSEGCFIIIMVCIIGIALSMALEGLKTLFIWWGS